MGLVELMPFANLLYSASFFTDNTPGRPSSQLNSFGTSLAILVSGHENTRCSLFGPWGFSCEMQGRQNPCTSNTQEVESGKVTPEHLQVLGVG